MPGKVVQAKWAAPRSKAQRMERPASEREHLGGPSPTAWGCKAKNVGEATEAGHRPCGEFGLYLEGLLEDKGKVHQVMTLPFPTRGSPSPGKAWVQHRLLGEGLDKGC